MVEPDARAGARRRRCADAERRALRAADLHRDARAARAARRRAARRRGRSRVSAADAVHLARPRVRRATTRTCRCGGARRRRGRRRPGPRRRRGHRPRRARPRRAAATRSSRSTLDAELLAGAARPRARGARVETVVADARDFDLGAAASALILVPMQTVQLLGGADGPRGVPAAAPARTSRPGGVLALAIADALEAYDERDAVPAAPDMRELDGTSTASRPVAHASTSGDGVEIERLPRDRRRRRASATVEHGRRHASTTSTRPRSRREARGCGLRVLPRGASIPRPTSTSARTVVMLGA